MTLDSESNAPVLGISLTRHPNFLDTVTIALTALETMVGVGLYLGLTPIYAREARRREASPRRVIRAVAVAVALGVALTYLIQFVSTNLGFAWSHAYYLSVLAPFTLTGVFLFLLLPSETRALIQASNRSPAGALLTALAVLAFTACISVAAADLSLEWLRTHTAARWRFTSIAPSALLLNVLILLGIYGLVFALTARLTTTLALVTVPYIALSLATLAKLKYMHTAVQPLDILRVPEFLPLFRDFFGTPVLLATTGLMAFWCLASAATRTWEPRRLSRHQRWTIGIVSALMMLVFPLAFTIRSFPPALALLKVFEVNRTQWEDQAKRRGLLVSFLSELPSMLVAEPPNYSSKTVEAVMKRYGARAPPPTPASPPINLVIYLVESFMDPDDLGLQFTAEPIPTIRALRKRYTSGYAIVPGEFGGSANTEFELFTGMTMTFLPKGSLPFRQYLRQPVPSLPRLLKAAGYTTTAIQPDPKHYYDRERAYKQLGFDSVVWLDEVPGIERGPRHRWPSDAMVVDAVIRASQRSQPFFVFAFPSSTHSSYHTGFFKHSTLRVRTDIPPAAADEVQEYINALHVADQTVARLIEHFQHEQAPTVIVILGDHLPPLSDASLRGFNHILSNALPAERAEHTKRVPLLVWANFSLPRDSLLLSVNALPSYLLTCLNIPATGFYALTDSVRHAMPSIENEYIWGSHGEAWKRDSLPEIQQAILDDYRLLQYDLLNGKQYALGADQEH